MLRRIRTNCSLLCRFAQIVLHCDARTTEQCDAARLQMSLHTSPYLSHSVFFSPCRYEPLTHSNVSILLKALCQCGQEGEAVKFHQRSLDLLYAPTSFGPVSSAESWSSSSGRIKKFLNTVTHGFVQHLASDHRGDDVIGVLDGVHASIERFSSLHAQHTGAGGAGVGPAGKN